MANPAKKARDEAQEIWPGASVFERTRNGIKHQHPANPDKFMLDTFIGAIHYGTNKDLEIETAWIDADSILDAPWQKKMVSADYNVFFGPGTQSFDAGQIIKYVHPGSGESISFQPQQLQWTNDLDQISAIENPQAVTPAIDDAVLDFQDAYGPGIHFQWNAQTDALAKQLILTNKPAAPPQFIIDGGNPVIRLQFIFQKSGQVDIYVGGVLWDEKANNPVTTSEEVEFRLGNDVLWVFRPAVSIDGTGEEIDATYRFRKTGPNNFWYNW